MNAHSARFPQEQEAQAEGFPMSGAALVSEARQARSDRAASIIRDCITLLRNSHRRSFEYRAQALDYPVGSEPFNRYRKWSDDQRTNMRRAIREIRIERTHL